MVSDTVDLLKQERKSVTSAVSFMLALAPPVCRHSVRVLAILKTFFEVGKNEICCVMGWDQL